MIQNGTTGQSLFRGVCLLALAGIAHILHLSAASLLDSRNDSVKTALIPDAESVRMYDLGFDRVVADIYWLMFIQYYGDRESCLRDKFRQAPAYLALVTHLDPHFIQPYWFSSFVLAAELNSKKDAEDLLDFGIAQNLPAKLQEDLKKESTIQNPPDPGEALLARKISELVERLEARPYQSRDAWNLMYIAGFNQFLYSNNEKRASEYYRLGSRMPDAPGWLSRQADIMAQGIRSEVKIIRTWRRILRETKDPMIQNRATAMLLVLWSRVYWDAPPSAGAVRQTALKQLKELGFDNPVPEKRLPRRSELEEKSAANALTLKDITLPAEED